MRGGIRRVAFAVGADEEQDAFGALQVGRVQLGQLAQLRGNASSSALPVWLA
jgi:hypothetical protein